MHGFTARRDVASRAAVVLTAEKAIERAQKLHEQRDAERLRLDEVRRYWMGRQKLPAVVPEASPNEVKLLARMSRVNVIGIVVESLAQSLAVEGFRAEREADNTDVWNVWQSNQLDARQALVHRSVLAYGLAYSVVTPGKPVPVIRGLSPRKLTTLYDGGAEWPTFALEWRAPKTWRLYDASAVYELKGDAGKFEHVSTAAHGAAVTPVVRYLEVQDPDWDDEPSTEAAVGAYAQDRQVIGQVAPLMTIQDQIDLITFNLLVAQHYAAFRQRFIIGWLAKDEATRMKMGASQWLTFEDGPDQVKVGDLEATSLDGYLESRKSSFAQAASLSQTPTHELIGDLVNLSAEALAAAEAGRDRKVADRQTAIGEGHEETLRLAGQMASITVPEGAQVVWRDTSARSFAATVDALGKAATMLKVPADELWERIPGVSQQDIKRWRERARAQATAAAGLADTIPIATNGNGAGSAVPA